MSAHFDIAIVGGGLVGATLAVALNGFGYRIILLEAHEPKASNEPSFDDRTLALNAVSCTILEGLGLWESLSKRATPIREILVSEMGRPGRVQLLSSEQGVEQFAQVVEARVFGQAVMEQLRQLPDVTFDCPAKVTALTQENDRVRFSVDKNGVTEEFSSSLLVAADGARSTVRQLCGVDAAIHNYEQTAIIANLMPEFPHQNRAFERFSTEGPLAMLPHIGGRCGLVWTHSNANAAHWLEADDATFLAEVQRRFGRRLGTLSQLGKRSSYPLYLVEADRNRAGRVVIIGNAAHSIHPVSAQGFNLGLRDVATLAELLIEARVGTSRRDPGETRLLEQYVSLRQADQDETIRYTDTLARVFTNPSFLVSKLRTAAMAAHDLLPSLKNKLALGAMGYRGELPQLARGKTLEDLRRELTDPSRKAADG